MNQRQWMGLVCGLAVLAGAGLVGCKKAKAPVPPPAADVGQVFMKVEECMAVGNTNGAIALFREGLADPQYANEKGWLFSGLLNLLLVSERIDEAEALFSDALGKDEALTRAGFGMLYGYYQNAGKAEALEAHVQKLLAAKLPQDLAAQVFAWNLGLLRAKGDFGKVVEQVPVCIGRFDAATSRRILGDIVNAELGAGRFDEAGRMVDAVEKGAGDKADLKWLVLTARGEMPFLKGEWAEGEKQFAAVATALPDGELNGLFSRAMSRVKGAQELDVADRLCEYVIGAQKTKTGTVRNAASQWMDNLKVRKDMAGVAARLEALLTQKVNPAVVFYLYRGYFYDVLGTNARDSIAAMVGVGEKLLPLVAEEEDQGQVKTMLLDGSFVTEDYAVSLKILEAGIQGRDPAWHDMAIHKARAHLALKEGRKQDAVENFKKFMESVAKWEKPEQDPISGVLYSKEMCLGRNYRRLGDIWKSADDAKAADASYAEARANLDKAMADVKADSPEADVIRAELAALDKAMGGK